MLLVRLCLLLVILSPAPGLAAWPWQDKPLAIINGRHYSEQDFGHWWQYYHDEKSTFSDKPDKFVNWQLQVQEAMRMQLDTLPDVQQRIEVFLKARSLMLLKYNEVDSKIAIKDTEIRALYKSDYSPSRLIAVLAFADEKAATSAYQKFVGSRPGLKNLKKMAEDKKAVFTVLHPQWLRPLNTPKGWFEKLQDTRAGDFVGPIASGKKFILIYVADFKPGSEVDFNHKKASIRSAIYSKMQTQLTEKLLKRLKKKYNVHVNKDLFKEIDLSAPKKANWDKILVSADRSRVTVGYFIEQCRKEQTMLQKQASLRGKRMAESIKMRAMSAMISNSLVDWAAADEHYQTKPPLKWEYKFYRQQSLIRALQDRMFKGGAEAMVSDDQALAYYAGHHDLFRTPATAKILLLLGPETEIERLWGAGMANGELQKTAHNYKVTVKIAPNRDMPLNHLSTAVREAIKQLAKNDISSPFQDDGQMALVQLFDHKPSRLVPFPKVKMRIIDKLKKEKLSRLHEEYIEKLRQHSSIIIKDSVWETIRDKNKAKPGG